MFGVVFKVLYANVLDCQFDSSSRHLCEQRFHCAVCTNRTAECGPFGQAPQLDCVPDECPLNVPCPAAGDGDDFLEADGICYHAMLEIEDSIGGPFDTVRYVMVHVFNVNNR